jgi:outer membrane immunogenic protein
VKLGLCGLIAAVCIAPAAAQEYQVSGAMSIYDDSELQLDAITVRGAAFFTPNFGVEGEFAFGPGKEMIGSIPGVVTNLKVGVKTDIGAYAIAKLPINNRFQIFGRVGYGQTEIEIDGTFPAPIGRQTESEDVGGFRYGGGVLVNFTDEYGIRADYTRVEMDEADNIDIDGGVNVYSLGLFIKF